MFLNTILCVSLLVAGALREALCDPDDALAACSTDTVALLQLRGTAGDRDPESQLHGAPHLAKPAFALLDMKGKKKGKTGKKGKPDKKEKKGKKRDKSDNKCLKEENKKCKESGSKKQQKQCTKDAAKKCNGAEPSGDVLVKSLGPKIGGGVSDFVEASGPVDDSKRFPTCLLGGSCEFGDGSAPVQHTKTKASAFFGEEDQWLGEQPTTSGMPAPKKELLTIAERVGRGAVAGIGDVDGDGIPDVAWGDVEKVSKYDSASFFSEIPPTCNKGEKEGECAKLQRKNVGMAGVVSGRKRDEYNPTITDGSVYIGFLKADGTFKGPPTRITLSDSVLKAAGAEYGPYSGKPLTSSGAQGDAELNDELQKKKMMTASFGTEVVGIGDWDADGTPDIAVLASGFDVLRCCDDNQGFDGGMGTKLGTGENLGCTMTWQGCGAQTGIKEGVPRLMPFIYRISLKADGSVKAAKKLSLPEPRQGYDYLIPDDYLTATKVTTLTVVGDVNGDGFIDIAVGTPADSAVCYLCGAIYVGLMTENGVDWMRTDARMTKGRPVPGIGTGKCASGEKEERFTPYNKRHHSKGDFKKEACVDGRSDDCFDFGGYVCAGGGPDESGSLDFDLMGFGDKVVGLGDVDGDGTPDLAVTSKWLHEGACGARGMVWILFLHTDGSVLKAQRTLGPKHGVPQPIGCGNNKGTPNDFPIGWTVAAAGDVTGDGVPDLLFGFENYEDTSKFAGGDVGKWARGGMIVLAPVYKSGAVGTEMVTRAEGKDCGEKPLPGTFAWLTYIACAKDTDKAAAPPHMSLQTPWKELEDLGYDDSCPLLYAKLDTSRSTPLKQNKEGCTKFPCNGFAAGETLTGYPGTCGNSGTRTGGAQFGASMSALGDIDGDGLLDLIVGAPGENGGHAANYAAGSFRILRGITKTAMSTR